MKKKTRRKLFLIAMFVLVANVPGVFKFAVIFPLVLILLDDFQQYCYQADKEEKESASDEI